MSKTRIFALLFVGIILIAVLTNPSKQQFEAAVSAKAKEILQKRLDYEHPDAAQLGMELFGNRVVQDFVNNSTVIENYYLFSLVKIRWLSQEIPVGGGAFRHVWLSPKIDDKAEEIIGILNNL